MDDSLSLTWFIKSQPSALGHRKYFPSSLHQQKPQVQGFTRATLKVTGWYNSHSPSGWVKCWDGVLETLSEEKNKKAKLN